jgi:hypothetical protein
MRKPFFINSNICFEQKDISSLQNMLSSMAGNTGNSYITYSLIKTLLGGLTNIDYIQNIYDYDFNRQDKDISLINSECSHVFLVLQDQIRLAESYGLRLPYQNIIGMLKRIKKPLVIAGLGANSFNGYDAGFHKKLSPELVTFLKFLSEHAVLIGVRGHYTQEVLHNLGIRNTAAIGCPSFYEMGAGRIITKKQYSGDFKVLYTSPLSGNHGFGRNIILQDEKELISNLLFKNGNFSRNSTRENLNLILGNYFCFPNIEQWKSFVSRHDFALGTRLHGCILSINSGVCAVCMNNDSRAREMCELLHIPYAPQFSEETNIEKIYEYCDYGPLNRNYPELYKNYVDFLDKNGVKIFSGRGVLLSDVSQPEFSSNNIEKEKIADELFDRCQAAKIPEPLVRLICCFIPKKQNRKFFRKKWLKEDK